MIYSFKLIRISKSDLGKRTLNPAQIDVALTVIYLQVLSMQQKSSAGRKGRRQEKHEGGKRRSGVCVASLTTIPEASLTIPCSPGAKEVMRDDAGRMGVFFRKKRRGGRKEEVENFRGRNQFSILLESISQVLPAYSDAVRGRRKP